jgi:hypothetical protein
MFDWVLDMDVVIELLIVDNEYVGASVSNTMLSVLFVSLKVEPDAK